MKIARKAFEPYSNIDPREVPIQDMVNRIDYEYTPLLWVFFSFGALVAVVVLALLAIISI